VDWQSHMVVVNLMAMSTLRSLSGQKSNPWSRCVRRMGLTEFAMEYRTQSPRNRSPVFGTMRTPGQLDNHVPDSTSICQVLGGDSSCSCYRVVC
jgi:hypothetical protein